MRRQALQDNPNPILAAFEFPIYLLPLGEGRIQTNKNDPLFLPPPLILYCNINYMIHFFSPDLRHKIYRYEEWI